MALGAEAEFCPSGDRDCPQPLPFITTNKHKITQKTETIIESDIVRLSSLHVAHAGLTFNHELLLLLSQLVSLLSLS